MKWAKDIPIYTGVAMTGLISAMEYWYSSRIVNVVVISEIIHELRFIN